MVQCYHKGVSYSLAMSSYLLLKHSYHSQRVLQPLAPKKRKREKYRDEMRREERDERGGRREERKREQKASQTC